jgi:hypothetical protein
MLLRQAGLKWWIIFSLSGHSTLFVMLLTSLYAFAVFRGVARDQKNHIEHPLTTSIYYLVFYHLSPFLGSLGGTIGSIGAGRLSQYLLVIAAGSFWLTFLVWIVIDPVAGSLEMLSPESRRHRLIRVAQEKIQRQQQEHRRRQLLDDILARQQQDRQYRQQTLAPYAERLAGLLAVDRTGYLQAESEAIEIGLCAWKMGGLSCMQQLHAMAMDAWQQRRHNGESTADYISGWWDGIGNWRAQCLYQVDTCLRGG